MADQFYGLTDPGKERSNNEDTFIAQPAAGGRFIAACVIDGVGGYAGGEVAAELAREAILQRLKDTTGDVDALLMECFELANRNIMDAKQQNKQHDSMACVATLALVDLEHNQFHFAHIGDTRLYLLRDHSLVKVTQDQSFVGFLEDSGRLSEEAAMAHPKRNEINRALGFELNLTKHPDYIETGHSPFLPGDTLLICSDGLTDMVPKAGITDILIQNTSLSKKCAELVASANRNGGKDNVTVVLVKNNKQAASHDATKPIAAQKKSAPAESKPAASNQAVPDHVTLKGTTAPKNQSGWLAFVSAIALIFMAVSIWLYVHYRPQVQQVVQTPAPAPNAPGALESRLQAAIDSAKNNLLILDSGQYPSPIAISRAIRIDRDSLFIKTKGDIVLQADSGYTGAAMEFTKRCKLIFLDSLSIKGFRTGIISFNNSLLLKNTRFVGCAVPVQNSLTIANNKYISGPLSALKADSVPVTAKHK